MSERDDRIGELYEAALKKPIGERAAFVAAKTGGDVDLRRRVDALLAGQHDTELPGYESAAGKSGGLLAVGTEIGTYRIDGPLGAGGMGVVYRATDAKLNRPAAIKVLPENLADPEARRRFQREAQMVSSLNHPHIVTVYDAGEYQGREYLITEYVDGGTLRQWAARPRGWRPIVELLIGVADGIAAAHEAGILHRDIKPENILLAKNGYAKLADFGLAKLFEADPFADDAFTMRTDGQSSVIGTAAYMSPEQAQGLPLDARSDVYSFGLVLYELLSGTRPFAERAPGVRRGAEAEAAPPLGEGVPAELRAVVAKALEPEPADRYQTMRDLVVDLRRLARRSAVETSSGTGAAASVTQPVTAGTGPKPQPRRRVIAWRIGYLLAPIALAAIVAFLTREYGRDAASVAPAEKVVAVLRFENETANPDDAYISDSLGNELRAGLVGVPGLKIAARVSSNSFRDQEVDLPTIASRLGATILINGSMRRRGATLTVVVDLSDAEGHAIRVPFKYERAEQDLLAMQQDIVTEVSDYLVPGTSGSAVVTAKTPTSESEAAHLLVQQGRYSEQEVRDNFIVDEEKLEKAIQFYRRATELDGSSIAAFGRLAGALVYRGDVEEARPVLEKALKLMESPDARGTQADRSDTYYTLGLYLLRNRSSGSEAAYVRSLELNPDNSDTLSTFGFWLVSHSRPQQGEEYSQRAIDLDRLSLSRYLTYAEGLGTRDRTEQILDLARTIEARFPNARGYLALARVYELAGELDVGIAWGLKALRLQAEDPSPNAQLIEDTLGQIAELYARIGDFEKAREYELDPGIGQLYWQRRYDDLIDLAEEIVISDPSDINVWYYLAFAYNATGAYERARKTLENMGLPAIALTEGATSPDDEAGMTYIDALQSLGEESKAKELAMIEGGSDSQLTLYEGSWWWATTYACKQITLGNVGLALDVLERLKSINALSPLPRLLDSPCFRRIATEPRYEAVIAVLEERQRILRERLPATLAEHGVADVTAAILRAP